VLARHAVIARGGQARWRGDMRNGVHRRAWRVMLAQSPGQPLEQPPTLKPAALANRRISAPGGQNQVGSFSRAMARSASDTSIARRAKVT
jgi:hypothetical protein